MKPFFESHTRTHLTPKLPLDDFSATQIKCLPFYPNWNVNWLAFVHFWILRREKAINSIWVWDRCNLKLKSQLNELILNFMQLIKLSRIRLNFFEIFFSNVLNFYLIIKVNFPKIKYSQKYFVTTISLITSQISKFQPISVAL